MTRRSTASWISPKPNRNGASCGNPRLITLGDKPPYQHPIKPEPDNPSCKGDTSTLDKRGHFYFGLTEMMPVSDTLRPGRSGFFKDQAAGTAKTVVIRARFRYNAPLHPIHGEVPEWLNGLAWKASVR